MIPLASLEALSTRLGISPPLDAETADGARAAAALDDASAMVRAEAGLDWLDGEEEDTLDPLLPDIVVSITLAAAARTYRNPDGFSQASTGDVSISYSREQQSSSVYLTKSEVRAIRRAAGRSSVGSLALESGFMPESADAYWVPVSNGGDPLPLGPWPWEV